MIYVKKYKFHANFHTSKSHENWYNEVFGHAKHESGLIFLITISDLVVMQLHGQPRYVQQNCCCLFFLCIPLYSSSSSSSSSFSLTLTPADDLNLVSPQNQFTLARFLFCFHTHWNFIIATVFLSASPPPLSLSLSLSHAYRSELI